MRTVPKVVGFNYAALGKNAKQAQQEAKAIHGLIARTAEGVVEIGRRLIEVHKILGRSHYQAWLRVEFAWNQSVASNFESVARRFDGLDCLNNFQPSALYMLSRNRIKEETAAEAIKRARNGETITLTVAKQIVSQRQPAAGRSMIHYDNRSGLRQLIGRWSERMGRDDLVAELLAIVGELQDNSGPLRSQKRREMAAV